jgi:hypothetical protein
MSHRKAVKQDVSDKHTDTRTNLAPDFTSKDRVLSADIEHTLLLEKGEAAEKRAKHEASTKLAPGVDEIKAVLKNPQLFKDLSDRGLPIDPESIWKGIIASMDEDAGLNSDRLTDRLAKNLGAPVGAPYVALGILDQKGMQDILKRQGSERKGWLKANYPDYSDLTKKENRDWLEQQLKPDSFNQKLKDFYTTTEFGNLLRASARQNPALQVKVEAANELILALQAHH